MRLIFIRHAEPDYDHNTLTERGFRESELLAERVPHWEAERFFVSPLARTYLTAKPSLDIMGREAEVLPWMREFSYGIHDPITGVWNVPWDYLPQYWTNDPLLQDKDNYYRNEVLQSAPQYEPAVHALRAGMDALLSEYGYYRKDGYYLTDDAVTNGDDDRTLVFFGHLGANLEAIGYLLDISPAVLKQAIYLAPTSVCILNAEKRQPGDPKGWWPAPEGVKEDPEGRSPAREEARSRPKGADDDSPDLEGKGRRASEAKAAAGPGAADFEEFRAGIAAVDTASYWRCGVPTDRTGKPGIAMFRAQVLGDVKHLMDAGQPISESGSFAKVFQK